MLKKELTSLLFGVGGPLVNCPATGSDVTKGLSVGEPNVWLEAVGAPLTTDEADVGRLEDWPGSSFVMVNSDGNFPEPLCLRRLLEGPWKSVGEACLDRFRGVWEVDVLVAEV